MSGYTHTAESICGKCGATYERPEWQCRNGYSHCGECRRATQQKWRDARKAAGNPVIPTRMPREYERRREEIYFAKPEARKRRNARASSYAKAEKNQIQVIARRKVRNEIVAGRLKRGLCEVCGVAKTQAHHDDYSKPLAIRWLCVQHHADHHKKARATNGGDA